MPEITDLITPALVIALFGWLRSDILKLHQRLDTNEKRLHERLDTTAKGINERLDASNRNTSDRIDRLTESMNRRFDGVLREIAELRERMAKLEGSLEGFLAGRRDGDAA